MRSTRSRCLKSQDLQRLLQVTPHLYAPCKGTEPSLQDAESTSVLAYPAPACDWLKAIATVLYASFDDLQGASYNVVNLQTGVMERIVARTRPVQLSKNARQDLVERGSLVIHADPTYRRARMAIPSGDVLIDSDFQTPRQIESSIAFQEYYRHIHIRYQMVFAIPSAAPDRTTFAAAMRWGRPFTERERAIGQLLQQHIRRACETRVARADAAGKTLETLEPSAFDSLGLSPRQTEVFYWLACGKRDSEIATILRTSHRTINNHVAAIYQHLGVENRATAIRLALETAMTSRAGA